MPAGATWDGVYYGSEAGVLHLVSQGDHVLGAWRTDSEDAHGELNGEVRGNLLSYRWIERKVEQAGGTVRRGTGYFVYVVADDGREQELLGERISGHAQAALWRARKWSYVKPDLWNVVPGGDAHESEDSDGDYYLDSDDDI